MDVNEQLGYLTAKIEDMSKTIQGMDGRLVLLEQKVSEKFTTAETAFRIVRAIALILVALVTLKFGDVATIWHNLMH